MGVWDDDAWDLIQKLLKVNSKDRIGAGCFDWVPPPIIDGTDAKDMNNGNRRIDEEFLNPSRRYKTWLSVLLPILLINHHLISIWKIFIHQETILPMTHFVSSPPIKDG